MAKSIPVKKAILSKKEKSPPVSLYDADVNDANYPDEGIPGYKDYANKRPAAIERAKGNSRDTDIELPTPEGELDMDSTNWSKRPKVPLDNSEDDGPVIKIEITPKRKKSIASY